MSPPSQELRTATTRISSADRGEFFLCEESRVAAAIRHFGCAFGVATIAAACTRSAAAPASVAPSSASATEPRTELILRRTTLVQRDSTGRTIPSGSSIERDTKAASDAINRRVRVLQVNPDHIHARVGDTLAPHVALRVSGLDSAGTEIPLVTPLYGPLKRNGVVQALRDGRWLAAKPGVDSVMVRVMRHDQPVSNDVSLVRVVVVEVFP